MQTTKDSNTAPPTTNDVKVWTSIVAVLAIVATAVVVLNLRQYSIAPFSDQASAEASTVTPAAPDANEATEDSGQFPATDDLGERVTASGRPWIAGRQENFRFKLDGVLPDQQTKILLETAMREAYGSLSTSNLEVAASTSRAEWFASSPSVIKSFASEIIDGGFAIGDGQIYIEGSVPNEDSNQNLQSLTSRQGMPATLNAQLEVTNQDHPRIEANITRGELQLSGTVPTDEIRQDITDAAINLYGEDHVYSGIRVDEQTYAPFALARWEETLTSFFPFDSYKVEISEGQFSGELRGGIAFDSSSIDLTSEGQSFLRLFPEIANRSTGSVTVVGHTDNLGSPESNAALSQQRADVVAAFLSQSGISNDRISATGLGDTEPLVPNTTEASRQQNRRVEVRWDL